MVINKRPTDGNISPVWKMAEKEANRQLAAGVSRIFKDNKEIDAWLKKHQISHYRFNQMIIMFDREEDAMHFYLTWA